MLLITYVTGYGDVADDIPEDIKQAMLAMLSAMYDCRGACEDLPMICKTLLSPYKDWAKLGACYG